MLECHFLFISLLVAGALGGSELFPRSNFTVCRGDPVTYTCNVSGSSLIWRWRNSLSNSVEEYVAVQRHLGILNTTRNLIGAAGVTTTLVHIDSAGTYILSTLQFLASEDLTFTSVSCNDQHAMFIFKEHNPPEAVEIILSSTCNKTEMSEVSLSWSIGNTHNLKQNYTFKFFSRMGTIKEVTATSPPITVSLLYNVNYTINATAANCAGIGPASFFNIILVKCLNPSSLMDINVLSRPVSLYEDSVVFYNCLPHLKPAGVLSSTCTKDKVWHPAIHCTPAISCGMPSVSKEVEILAEFFNQTEANTLLYKCKSGFTPESLVKSVCSSNGSWEPDPLNHNCTDIPGRLGTDERNEGNTILILSSSFAAVSIVTLLVGTLIGAVGFYCCKKKPNLSGASRNSKSQPDTAVSTNPVYEEITAVDGKKKIIASKNVAYGQAVSTDIVPVRNEAYCHTITVA